MSRDHARASRSLREARYGKYSRVQLRDIRVRKAVTAVDFQTVEQLRAAGFVRVVRHRRQNWLDQSDYAPGVFSLIGYDEAGQPLATMRIQDGRRAELELARFVPLHHLVQPEERPCVQFARLSVLRSPRATEVMFGLFKAAWLWCHKEELRTIVIATPPWSKPIYDFMLFEHLGPDGEFEHEVVRGAQHVTMKLPVLDLEPLWRRGKSPLCTVFFETEHLDLVFHN